MSLAYSHFVTPEAGGLALVLGANLGKRRQSVVRGSDPPIPASPAAFLSAIS